MTNPSTLAVETKLYCPAEPDGRVFPAGQPWPGDAWSADPGGAPVGGKSVTQAMKDLVAAQDQIDTLSGQLSSKDHDNAVLASQRDEAVGKVADLEQRAIAGEQGQAAADARVHDMMIERDQARSNFQRVSDQVAEANAKAATVDAVTAKLEAADQTIANLNGQIASLTADLDKATAPAPKPKKGAPAEDAPDNPATGGAEPASGA